jgi:hypothetical protein
MSVILGTAPSEPQQTDSVYRFVLWVLIGCIILTAAVLHETSCGCFGAAQVNPWITMMFDLMIVGLLAVLKPKGMVFHRKTFYQELTSLKQYGKVVTVVII